MDPFQLYASLVEAWKKAKPNVDVKVADAEARAYWNNTYHRGPRKRDSMAEIKDKIRQLQGSRPIQRTLEQMWGTMAVVVLGGNDGRTSINSSSSETVNPPSSTKSGSKSSSSTNHNFSSPPAPIRRRVNRQRVKTALSNNNRNGGGEPECITLSDDDEDEKSPACSSLSSTQSSETGSLSSQLTILKVVSLGGEGEDEKFAVVDISSQVEVDGSKQDSGERSTKSGELDMTIGTLDGLDIKPGDSNSCTPELKSEVPDKDRSMSDDNADQILHMEEDDDGAVGIDRSVKNNIKLNGIDLDPEKVELIRIREIRTLLEDD